METVALILVVMIIILERYEEIEKKNKKWNGNSKTSSNSE